MGRNRWRLTLGLVCLLLHQLSFAQVSVQGHILGQEDKQAIAAAIVSLSPIPKGPIRQTTTDREGNFSLYVSGCDSAWLRVRSLGSAPYATKISTREASRHTIYLTSAEIKLKEVVIDAPTIYPKGRYAHIYK